MKGKKFSSASEYHTVLLAQLYQGQQPLLTESVLGEVRDQAPSSFALSAECCWLCFHCHNRVHGILLANSGSPQTLGILN